MKLNLRSFLYADIGDQHYSALRQVRKKTKMKPTKVDRNLPAFKQSSDINQRSAWYLQIIL